MYADWPFVSHVKNARGHDDLLTMNHVKHGNEYNIKEVVCHPHASLPPLLLRQRDTQGILKADQEYSQSHPSKPSQHTHDSHLPSSPQRRSISNHQAYKQDIANKGLERNGNSQSASRRISRNPPRLQEREARTDTSIAPRMLGRTNRLQAVELPADSDPPRSLKPNFTAKAGRETQLNSREKKQPSWSTSREQLEQIHRRRRDSYTDAWREPYEYRYPTPRMPAEDEIETSSDTDSESDSSSSRSSSEESSFKVPSQWSPRRPMNYRQWHMYNNEDLQRHPLPAGYPLERTIGRRADLRAERDVAAVGKEASTPTRRCYISKYESRPKKLDQDSRFESASPEAEAYFVIEQLKKHTLSNLQSQPLAPPKPLSKTQTHSLPHPPPQIQRSKLRPLTLVEKIHPSPESDPSQTEGSPQAENLPTKHVGWAEPQAKQETLVSRRSSGGSIDWNELAREECSGTLGC